MPEIGNSLLLNKSFFTDHYESAIHARQCLMIESNHLSIALLDNENVLAFEQFSFEEWIDEWFSQSKIAALKQSLPALVLFRADAALLLPEVFRKNRDELLHRFFTVNDHYEVAEHKPASFPAVVCFLAGKSLLALIRNQFPGAVLMHHSLPVLWWMMNHAKLKQPSMVIELYQKRLFIYAVNEGTPLFYNSFEVNSAEDVAYYTLFVMEQLEMEPVRQTVYFKASMDNENLLTVCRNFIPAFISMDVLKPHKNQDSEWLFPFLCNALLCE
ncbi:MAG: DUF3822 family protein [Bacteroidia bacterium]|nr:DUF3822 family protein [Bacteroidia bacterium]